jgi:hypothetical protein
VHPTLGKGSNAARSKAAPLPAWSVEELDAHACFVVRDDRGRTLAYAADRRFAASGITVARTRSADHVSLNT